MRLSIKGMALAAGLLWGCAILFVGLINMARPTYGMSFLSMMSSVYPWFHSSHTLTNVGIGAVDGFFDGVIAGGIFAWVYNSMFGHSHTTTHT